MENIKQNIISTADNQRQQKSNIFYSSSTVFWCVFNRKKKIDTSISFLNHFLLKKNINSVSMRLSIREMNGELVNEVVREINEPKAYSFSISNLISNNISKGEYVAYIEFTSEKNLNVPFCAVVMTITSPNSVDQVHTYGRALEVNEINSPIDFSTSYESGWTIYPQDKSSNCAILHNGRLFSEIDCQLFIFKNGSKISEINLNKKKLVPFSTLKIDLEKIIENQKNYELQKIINNATHGEIDAKIIIKGLKGCFPRLLFVATYKENEKNTGFYDFDFINITHSNFDFNNAKQPKSKGKYGFINNPFYPIGIEDSGFRYYPSSDLKDLYFKENTKIDSYPLSLIPLSSLKILSLNKIPSRIVGASWVQWKNEKFIKECSTGTFIIEYNESSAYWHWGLLSSSSKDFDACISLLNPYSEKNKENNFKLRIYGENGLIKTEMIKFKGTHFCINFDAAELEVSTSKIWYAITGEGVGKFNIFSTSYFPDMRDGTIEHAF